MSLKRIVRNLPVGILIVAIVVLVSCAEDDTDPAAAGSFTYDGTTYTVDKLILENGGQYQGTSPAVYDVVAYLVTSSVSVDSAGTFSGSGEGILIDVNTESSATLTPDSYSWDATNADPKASGRLTDGMVLIDYDFDDSSGTSLQADGGSATITESSGVYEIEFTLNIDNGETVTGSFSGEVTTTYTD